MPSLFFPTTRNVPTNPIPRLGKTGPNRLNEFCINREFWRGGQSAVELVPQGTRICKHRPAMNCWFWTRHAVMLGISVARGVACDTAEIRLFCFCFVFLLCGHLDFESAVTASNDEFKAVLIARTHAC